MKSENQYEKAKEGEMVRMAYGNRCEFMVPRKFLGTMDDLGWRWSERDGCMVAVSTAHSLGAVKSKEIQNDIQRRYAETWLNRELQKPAFRKYRKRIKRDERGRVTQVVLS